VVNIEPVKRNRTERKKEETRKKIISVAIDLFNRQGFERTTVEQIAGEADIARGTVFNHFPAKEAIVLEYVQKMLKEIGPEIVKKVGKLTDTRARITALFHLSRELLEARLNDDVAKKYMTYMIQAIPDTPKRQDLRSGYGDILTEIIKMGQQDGEIRRDIPAETLSIYLDWNNALVMMAWLAYPEMSLTDMVGRMIDIFLNGAVNREGKET